MRDRNVFGIRRALPRMSWSPRNLYNLYRRSLTELKSETDFTRTGLTLFQQRWKAKQLTRAYHGDHVNEKIFKRWYLPTTLPDVRPHPHARRAGDDAEALSKWMLREKDAAREKRRRAEEEKLALAPVASLMYEEVERRMDVFVFRCCFAHSVYEARRMIIHGRVLLNGKKHSNANTRLAPGDMVSVDPSAIRFLRPSSEATLEDIEKPVEAKEKETEDPVEAKAKETEESAKAEEDAENIEASAESKDAAEDGASAEAKPKTETASPPAARHQSPLMRFLAQSKIPLTPFHLPPYAAPFLFIPPYIEVSFATCSAIFVRRPTARYNYSEIPSPYEADGEIMRLSWEWYNKVRPRMRSKSQLARMPDNRKETRVIPGVGRAGMPAVHSKLPLLTGSNLKSQIAQNSVY